MAEHDFTIRFRVDNADAKRVHAAEAAAYRQRIKDANDAAKAVAAAGTKEADDRKRVMKVVADAEKEQAKARVAAAKEVDAANRAAAKEAADAAKEAGKGWDAASSMAAGFLKTIGGIGATALGLGGVQQILGGIAESFERARKQAEEAGNFASSYRETLKEIAYLKGSSGPTSEVVRADLDFRKQTLQTQAEARGTQGGFLNAAAISIDTPQTRAKMTQEEASRAQIFAGQMQARVGGSGEAFGLLAGAVPSMMTQDRVNDQDIAKKMTQMFNITSKGIGAPADFAKSLGESGGLAATGAYSDPARLAVMQAAISLSSPTKVTAGTAEVNRMISGGRLDPTGAPGSKRAPSEYLKSIGVTDQDDDLTGAMKMIGDIEVQKARYEKENVGKQFPLGDYIKEQGYGNITDINVFKGLYSRRKDIRDTLMPMADKTPTMAETGADFDVFKDSVVGQKMKGDVLTDRVQQSMGGGAAEYQQRLAKTAFNVMQRKGNVVGSFDDWKNSMAVQGQMVELLRSELIGKGEDVGVQTSNIGVGEGGGIERSDPLAKMFQHVPGTLDSAESIYQLGIRVKQKGGDPMAGNTPQVKELNATLERMADTLDRTEKIHTGVLANSQPPAIQVAVPGGMNAGRVR